MDINEVSLMWLYEAVRIKLGSEYDNVTYQTMKEDVEGAVGIYLYESANERQAIDGNIIYDCIKIQVQVNSEKNIQGLQRAMNYLDMFTRKMENEPCNLNNLTFIEVNHLGPRAVVIGKNQFGISVVKCTLDLKYIFDADK